MEKVALLICSCDYYSDCWRPILKSFEIYWPDCEYDKLIVSNHKKENLEGAKIISVGDHKGWATDTLKAVEMTDYDFYIYFQEDYFLRKKVDNVAIKEHVQHCIDYKVDYLKIEPDAIDCDKYRIDGSDYCVNPPVVKYSINSAIAIWHRSLFKKICVPGYTGWDFEYKIIGYIAKNNIQFKSEVLHSSVVISKGIQTIIGNGIQRGKWTPAGVKFLKENGFEDLVGQRKIQNKFYSWVYLHGPRNRFLKLFHLAFLRILRYFNIN